MDRQLRNTVECDVLPPANACTLEVDINLLSNWNQFCTWPQLTLAQVKIPKLLPNDAPR